MKSTYNKFPVVKTDAVYGTAVSGYQAIALKLSQAIAGAKSNNIIVAIECYQGVAEAEIKAIIHALGSAATIVRTEESLLPEAQVENMVYPDVTDDEVFGYVTRLGIQQFFDTEKVAGQKNAIARTTGLVIIYGPGTPLFVEKPQLLVYMDMPRWEIVQRFRRNEICNLGSTNYTLKASLQYKRSFYVDWRVLDKVKKKTLPKADYVIDTTKPGSPVMVAGTTFFKALEATVRTPFRLVPFFDPGPWGGQWMKEQLDLDKNVANFAWCFDCVPEENSLLFQFGDHLFETPSINLVYFQPHQLLGDTVQARFGNEFPIRFDFLDTIDGGNLSLQVHPTTEYAQENFGIHYTQDESYYMLEATEGAHVYLGIKDETDVEAMIGDMENAYKTAGHFDAEKYVEKWPVKKHDHILIPAGTIHCSGKNSMVLEISATPFNFTFKLWDWGRMGLDGTPRPIHINHGKHVIDASRRTDFCKKELINSVAVINEGDGWIEEKTGLHEREFIETRRHWFTKKVTHYTNNAVQVLNLIDGRRVLVESPENLFEPLLINYAETFVVPAAVSAYTITPYGDNSGAKYGTIKAFIRTNA